MRAYTVYMLLTRPYRPTNIHKYDNPNLISLDTITLSSLSQPVMTCTGCARGIGKIVALIGTSCKLFIFPPNPKPPPSPITECLFDPLIFPPKSPPLNELNNAGDDDFVVGRGGLVGLFGLWWRVLLSTAKGEEAIVEFKMAASWKRAELDKASITIDTYIHIMTYIHIHDIYS